MTQSQTSPQNEPTPEKRPLKDFIEWPVAINQEKYPWDEWFDGSVWRLRQGEDFDVNCESMRSAIYMAAYRKKYKVKTHIPKTRDIVYVQKIKG